MPEIEQPYEDIIRKSQKIDQLYDAHSIANVDILRGQDPYPLQQEIENLESPFTLLNAGCGEGKTAFALKLAQKLINEGKINRIIFTLPTRFTSNNMRLDFEYKYSLPRHLLGICHADSLEFLRRLAEQEGKSREEVMGGLQDEHFMDNFYYRPTTISTVDHLLMSFYHGYKYADRAFGNILQSLVIFDELHHYETQTMKAIYESLEILRQLNINHLIMTATIPEKRISTLNERYPTSPSSPYYVLRSDGKEIGSSHKKEERREKQSFRFVKISYPMINVTKNEGGVSYQVSPQLLKEVNKYQNLRQIIFVNQVEKAKAIAKTLKETGFTNVICYHAEFIQNHRIEKENQIRRAFAADHNAPCILVSTQIAELSLDISADRMYTEIAPVDDIIQRGGRLHRNAVRPTVKECGCSFCRKRPVEDDYEYEMVIFSLDFTDKSDILPYVDITKEAPDSEHLLNRSWNAIRSGDLYTFENALCWVNHVYKQDESLVYERYRKAVLDDTIFGSKPSDRYFEKGKEEDDNRIVIRDQKYQTYEVVPSCCRDHLSEDINQNRRFLLSIHQWKFWNNLSQNLIRPESVAIRLFQRRKEEVEHRTATYNVLFRPYDYEIGIDFSGLPEFDANITESQIL